MSEVKIQVVRGIPGAILEGLNNSAVTAIDKASEAAVSAASAESYLLQILAANSQTFNTVSEMKAMNIFAGSRVKTYGYYAANDGGGAEYVVKDSTTEPSSFYITLNNGKFAVLKDYEVHPFQVGFTTDIAKLDTLAKVTANWLILKTLLADLKTSARRKLVKFNTITTPNRVFAEWISGRSCPIGFYSDSTTDGATTTGHTPSTHDDTAFTVTINESPNAYPKLLENFIKDLTSSYNPVRCYNGGFDSMSYANGFGLNHWYNTWFRPAGSNVNFSDVKMIVLGFGTSDSINQNNTAGVIDNFIRDLECTVIDCFLRGVQPVIQAPVRTTQKVGTTMNYRNANESITIIETCQKQLCEKYNLEYFSMAEPLEKALNGFGGYKYSDFMSPDKVHPNDMGHRLHTSYLCTKFNPNIAKITEGKSVANLFPGHPAYIPLSTDVIADGGSNLILKPIDSGYLSDNSYYYKWKASEGNIRNDGEFLIKIPVYVEKPTVLFTINLENQQAYGHGRPIGITNKVINSTITITSLPEQYKQPENLYFTNKFQTTFLPFGLNIITVYANNNAIEQKFGGFYLADASLTSLKMGRGTAGATYAMKVLKFDMVDTAYTCQQVRREDLLNKYYNQFDNRPLYTHLTLNQSLVAGTTYQIFTHYNDVQGYQDCYNLVEITGDTIVLKTKNLAGITTIGTSTVTGLNALMIYGAKIKLLYLPQNSISSGVTFQLSVDGVVKATIVGAVGQVWSEGYGFDAPNMLCSDITITSWNGLQTFDLRYSI